MKPGNLSNQVPISAACQSWMMRESNDKKICVYSLEHSGGYIFYVRKYMHELA